MTRSNMKIKAVELMLRLTEPRSVIRVQSVFHQWLKLFTSSSGVVVAVPTLPTTMPAA